MADKKFPQTYLFHIFVNHGNDRISEYFTNQIEKSFSERRNSQIEDQGISRVAFVLFRHLDETEFSVDATKVTIVLNLDSNGCADTPKITRTESLSIKKQKILNEFQKKYHSILTSADLQTFAFGINLTLDEIKKYPYLLQQIKNK